MARSDRTGNRRSRDSRNLKRIPEMGYYLVVTDAEGTEPSFFNGLHRSMSDDVKQKLVIKVIETKTQDLIQKCIELTAYDAQYRIPWIVFDRDKVVNFDEIIAKAEKSHIHVGWSNPCFEIWMFAYFGSMPSVTQSWTCCSKFAELYERKTGIEYSKSDSALYARLCKYGDEKQAIRLCEQRYKQHIKDGNDKPSTMCPCSTVHELVGEIRKKFSE